MKYKIFKEKIMPYAIDLFSGAGGMSEGILQAGFHILFSSDINEQVEATYKNRHEQLGLIQNYNTHYERIDIRDLNGNFIMESIKKLEDTSIPDDPDIDAIFGGPPCQGFSLAGKRKQNDPRNFLFKEYLRLVDEIRPKYVIMENVEGFMTTKLYNFIGVKDDLYSGNQLITKILLAEFTKIGYKTLEPKILDASDYGVPQKRNRAIFIAYSPDFIAPKYPVATHRISRKIKVVDAIGDLISDSKKRKKYNPIKTTFQLESCNGRTRMISGSNLPPANKLLNHEFSKHEEYIVERFSLYKKGEDTSNLRKRISDKGISLKRKPHLLKLLSDQLSHVYNDDELIQIFRKGSASKEMIDILLTKKNNRKKLDPLSCSSTIVTLPDDYISPFENRTLSVREMARLQSFDDSFEFLGKRTTGGLRRRTEIPQYSQVGNAVPPLLSAAIAKEIFNAIEKGKTSG